MRILFRADGNGTIGLGHIVRSLALATIVREVAECVLLTCTPSAVIRGLAAQAAVHLLELPALAAQEEANYLLAHVISPTDILVLDGYYFTAHYRACIRQSHCRLVCIDDLHEGFFPADLIINHSPGIVPTDYRALPSTRFCLGPDFSLLRPPFLRQVQAPKTITAVTSVLLCFGGADPLGLTARCLTALLCLPFALRIGLLLGGATTPSDALQAVLRKYPMARVETYHSLPAETMVNILAEYDAVICPASTILIESLVLGCPTVTGYYVDNQQALAAYVHQHQQAYSVGDFTALSDEQLYAALWQGLCWLSAVPRHPYVTQLAPEQLRAEFLTLCATTA